VTVAAVALPGLSVDYGPIVGGYLGLLLLASAFLAMGILASALTQNQIVAFILGLLFCFFFFLIDKVAILFPASFAGVFEYLSVDTHFANIARGVIDTRDIVYYLTLTASALYFTVRALRKP
jgi:ABC-2 type transport system permease protein